MRGGTAKTAGTSTIFALGVMMGDIWNSCLLLSPSGTLTDTRGWLSAKTRRSWISQENILSRLDRPSRKEALL
ncbi:hypothetical protein MAR_ORF359 [Marseillevirus marseillevirus]|uniref:Uncharacterized protein n=1 Tax=Marseillevirus marseillevirus TaxID=694581 RepID=D2XAZ8_GBMV|nr:hypothetical protein MAR_ORF359 [Marseillevirus marseillevirus]ADB04125.1 hypothetical protein MAR_ORF359 [Marseillevirus marseillevirus]